MTDAEFEAFMDATYPEVMAYSRAWSKPWGKATAGSPPAVWVTASAYFRSLLQQRNRCESQLTQDERQTTIIEACKLAYKEHDARQTSAAKPS